MLGNEEKAFDICAKSECAMEYKVEEIEDLSRCLQCGSVIDYGGRPDRKFCSAGCKNRYHNYRRFRRKDLAQRSGVGKLDKNYEILAKLISLGLKSMDRITMNYMGFNPDYATSITRIGRKNVYTCFDIRYEITPTRVKAIMYIEEEEIIVRPAP